MLVEEWMNGHFKSSNAKNDENQEEKSAVTVCWSGLWRFCAFSAILKQTKEVFFTCKLKKFWIGVTFVSLNSQKSILNTFSKLIQMHLFSFFFF